MREAQGPTRHEAGERAPFVRLLMALLDEVHSRRKVLSPVKLVQMLQVGVLVGLSRAA